MRPGFLHLLLAVAACTSTASARNLVDLLDDPRAGTAVLEPALAAIGPALSDAVASTYPVPSASSSVSYAWDPAADTFVQRSDVGSPLLGERADTIGRDLLNVTVGYSYVALDSIDGDDLSSLTNRTNVDGRQIIRRATGTNYFTRANGLQTQSVPILARLDLGVQAHVASAVLTYGVTPDLDLGAVVPVVASHFRVGLDVQTPDPRRPAYALCPRTACPTNPPPFTSHATADSALGLGDVVLRAKQALVRTSGADIAAMLSLSLPTGNPRDFQGLGYTRVSPMLIASRYFGGRVQSYANAGVDLNTAHVGRSVVRWALGTNVQVLVPLTAGVTFLGRHELDRQSTVALPFFFQIQRNDVVDAAVGLRLRLGEHASLAANVVLPVNDDGLRADVTPTIAAEWVF